MQTKLPDRGDLPRSPRLKPANPAKERTRIRGLSDAPTCCQSGCTAPPVSEHLQRASSEPRRAQRRWREAVLLRSHCQHRMSCGLGELLQPRSNGVTRSSGFLPPRIPSSARGHASGLSGALRHGVVLLRLRRPPGYGFRLRRTLRKCTPWHLGAGPTRSLREG